MSATNVIARINAAIIAFEAEALDAAARPRLEALREELIRLCNPHIKNRPEPAAMTDAWWAKGWIAGLAFGIFIIFLANAVRTLAKVDPEPRREAYRLLSMMYALAALVIFLVVFVPYLYIRYPYKMGRFAAVFGRRFGNVVGIIGLSLLGLIGVIIGWLIIMFGSASAGS